MYTAQTYLEQMRLSHAESLKNRIVKEAVAAISNITFTDVLLSSKFADTLIKGLPEGFCDEERKLVKKELGELSLMKARD